jgi:hypothetical protein
MEYLHVGIMIDNNRWRNYHALPRHNRPHNPNSNVNNLRTTYPTKLCITVTLGNFAVQHTPPVHLQPNNNRINRQ